MLFIFQHAAIQLLAVEPLEKINETRCEMRIMEAAAAAVESARGFCWRQGLSALLSSPRLPLYMYPV
jgi:hypothetical protein